MERTVRTNLTSAPAVVAVRVVELVELALACVTARIPADLRTAAT